MLLLNLIAAATFAVVIQQTTSFSGLRCHLATHTLSRRMLSAKAGVQHHHRGVLRLYSTKVKEDFSALLEDLMYSGELETLLKRNSKRIFQESFMNFLADKLTSADDEDEIEMMKDIQQRVGQKLKETGGDMAVELVYDTRLDKIAFTAPKLRRKYITDNIHEMTDGFILHVQRLLQEIPDEESKIVLASILQMIGQAKKIDLLGQYSTLLNKNDQDLLEGNVQNLNENLEQSAIVGNRNEQVRVYF